jgi:hypothetical protein
MKRHHCEQRFSHQANLWRARPNHLDGRAHADRDLSSLDSSIGVKTNRRETMNEILREILQQIEQAINDLEMSNIAVPMSLRKAARVLYQKLYDQSGELPVARPMGNS